MRIARLHRTKKLNSFTLALLNAINVKSKSELCSRSRNWRTRCLFSAFFYIIGETHLSMRLLISTHKLVSFLILLV
jgi:hypothetical protein